MTLILMWLAVALGNAYAAVPGAPTDTIATPGNGQATVSFAAPLDDGGSPVISYTATASPGGHSASGPATPITVSGLTNGTAYTFTVTASNEAGAGPPSSPSNTVKPAPESTGLDTSLYEDDIAVNGVPIGFTFKYWGVDYTAVGISTNGWLHMSEADGTYNNTDFPFTEFPLNGGIAAFFDDLLVGGGKIYYRTLGTAPNRRLVVQYHDVLYSESGAPMGAFQVVLFETTNQIKFQYRYLRDPRSLGNSATIGLDDPATDSSVRYSYNSASLQEQQAILFTPDGAGSYGMDSNAAFIWIDLSGLTANAPQDGGEYATAAISLSWPETPGANAYRLQIAQTTDGTGIVDTVALANVTALDYAATALTRGGRYYARVAASVNGGSTYLNPSPFSDGITIDLEPGAPTNVAATPGNRRATVTFSPPASNNGSAILDYTVTANPGGLTASGTGSPITVSGLSNGSTYTFTVSARNMVGSGPPSQPSPSVTLANLPETIGIDSGLAADDEAVNGLPIGFTFNYWGTNHTTFGLSTNGWLHLVEADFLYDNTDFPFTEYPLDGSIAGFFDDLMVGEGKIYYQTLGTAPNRRLVAQYHDVLFPGIGEANLPMGTFQVILYETSNQIKFQYRYLRSPASLGSSATIGLDDPATSNYVRHSFDSASLHEQQAILFTPDGAGSYSRDTNAVFAWQDLNGLLTDPPQDGGEFTLTTIPFSWAERPGANAYRLEIATETDGTAIVDTIALGNVTAHSYATAGLSRGVRYYARVSASSNGGASYQTISNFSDGITVDLEPGAPFMGTATAGNGQVTVSFSAPLANGGSPITGYTVTASPGGLTMSGLASPLTVSGLTNGTAYTFTVTASNAAGAGAASGVSNSSTPFTVPGAPDNIVAVAGNGQATISFSAPQTNGGSPITSYTVSASPGGLTASGAASPLTVTGLTNGTAYTFTVTASNAAGVGTASGASNPVTPITVPGPPSTISATAGNGQATVSFNAPESNGGSPVSGYTATANHGGFTASGASSPLTVTGLANGTAYTFTVSATNQAGTGPSSAASNSVTPATVPGPPSGVSATGGNGQAVVSFSAPAVNGGSPVTSYTVTASPGGQSASGAASPLTVSGLTNGTAYTFTVIASNGVGAGTASTASNPVTPATVPGPPSAVSATEGNGQAVVSFTPPASDGGNAVSSYTVSASPGGLTASGAASPLTVSGLTNGTAYTFTVTASNGVGTGAASTASNPVTPATVPGPPTSVSATGGNGQASISFTAPLDNGGSPLSGYTAVANPGGFSASGASSPLIVTGLANGTAYTFTVSASNGVGSGAASAASNPVTPATVPGAPANVNAVAGNGQASISFSSPADNGSSITGYTVTASPGGFTAAGAGSPLTVTGLTNGTVYTFTVTASNAVGTGVASGASSPVTPATVPGAPINVMATPGNAQAVVSFTAPTSTGGKAISGYTVTANPGGLTASGAASPLTVGGLSNGTAYTFTVTASNAVGSGAASVASDSVTPATIPDPPTAVSAVAGNGQASISFTAPLDNGGSAITGYTVTSSPGDLSASGASSPLTVTGLDNGTLYTFTVIASNAVGSGVASAASTGVTPATVPGSPTAISAVAGNRQATVSFVAPAVNGGSPVSGYTVTASPGGFTASGASSPLTVTGLTNGTVYTFTVSAANGAGTGSASSASNSVTPATVPGAPTNAVATSGNGQASISFTAPEDNGGSAVIGYTVSASPGGHVASSDRSPITVSGLTNGTSYTFTVTASNVAGAGVASAASNQVTPATVPGAPANAVATPGNGQASISFSAPGVNGGSPVTGYTVTANPGGRSATGAGSPLVVTGLTNGTAYTFTVTAANVAGSGVASESSAPVTPVTVPGAPTSVTATPGNRQATVSFTAPAATGGSPLTGYTVTANPGGLTASGVASPLTVGELDNGTAYTFTVTAANAVGSGPASSASASVTPATVPGAPTNVAALAGNALATVSFTAPASTGGSPITSYTVTSSPDGLTASGASSPIALSGLTNGTAYTFTVTASNAAGSGTASGASNQVTPATVPGAPTNISATAGNGQATITFTAPAPDGGSPFVSYTVTSMPGALTNNGPGSPLSISGLTNGTAYTFTVTANRQNGAGETSVASNAVTPATVPGPPTGIGATAGNGQAIISFAAPADNGGRLITGYTAISNPGNHSVSGADSPLTVSGLSNGTAYTFTVTATNSIGTGAASSVSDSVTPATVPGAPVSVAAVAGNAQATVTFSVPLSNGGSSITGYTVTSSPGGLSASGATSPLTVSGLTNGTAYSFTVSATNSAGTGAASEASPPVTPLTVPGAPVNVSATAGNAQASVSFSAPALSGGSPISSYTVTASPGGLSASGPASPLTVTELSNGTAYTFTVTATNSVGSGALSAASTPVTPLTVPGVPTQASAVAGNGQAAISFSAPASTGGSPITVYTVTSSPGGLSTSGPASPLTVTGLTNGTAYTFTVTAASAVGSGTASAASNPVTPATVPGAPIQLSATAGNGQASVTFSAPLSSGGSAISSYTVTASPGGQSISGATSPLTVSGLTNGTAYSFTVTATNAVGAGAASAPSNSVTPATVPGAPLISNVTAGNGQADITFSALSSNGGSAISSYTVTASPGGLSASGPASPLTVSGLTNGTAYTFTVVASNIVGPGAASAASNPVTPATVPGAPTQVNALAGNGQAFISFAAPAVDGGSAVSGYTVTASPGGHTASGLGSPLTVSGLTNGTAYTFTVIASNAVGPGAASTASAPLTPATVPGAPSQVSAVAGNGQATIGFSAPADNGGSAISSYSVISSPDGLTASGPASPLTVSGLSNGTAYTFTVIATNGVGQGAASAASSPVTPATVPGAPVAISAVAGNGQATISFSAPPSTGGSPITNYTVTSNPGGHTASGMLSPLTVSGLTNGTAYTFTVIASNAVGPGTASSESNPVTPATVPGAPTQVSATPGNGQAFISFSAPSDNGGSAISSYTVTSSPGGLTVSGQASPLTLSGLTNGIAYVFTVTASNGEGQGAASEASTPVTPATVPEAPAQVSATAGNAQATISFSAPSDTGGSAITSYTVTSTPGGLTVSGPGSPLTVSGLTNGTAYAFTVTAANSVGQGAASEASALVTPATVPGAPTQVSAVSGNAQATISFAEPLANGGSVITSYTVTASPGAFVVSGAASPLVITGLSNGTAYSFTVTASNRVGQGAASAASTSVTPATVPGAPALVSATAGNAQASVSFAAPSDTGGSPLTGYTVTASPGGFSASGAASPLIVSGLSNGTAYTFTVTAANSVGTGAGSAASNPVTPFTVPDPPTSVSASPGNGQARVSFSPPLTDGGSAITSYTVTSTPGGKTASGAASPLTVTGLTNGTAYTFTVAATNAAGKGAASAASAAVTPATVPKAPTSVSALAGNGQATVSFVAPTANGGSAIIGYTVTASPGGQVASSDSSPITVSGLSNGTAYTFTVTAANVLGTGAASAASNPVTPITVPGAPSGLTVIPGIGMVTISFTPPPDNGGSPITHFTVITSPAEGVDSQAGTTATTRIISALANRIAYSFTVTATNAAGMGAASTPVSMTLTQLGDVNGNGTVGMEDAILILKFMTRTTPLPPLFLSADTDGNRKLHYNDAIFVLRHIAQ